MEVSPQVMNTGCQGQLPLGWYHALEFSETDFLFYLAINFESLKIQTILDTHTSHKPRRSVNFRPKRKTIQRREKEMQRQTELLTPERHTPPSSSRRAIPERQKCRGLEPETHLRGLGSVRKRYR